MQRNSAKKKIFPKQESSFTRKSMTLELFCSITSSQFFIGKYELLWLATEGICDGDIYFLCVYCCFWNFKHAKYQFSEEVYFTRGAQLLKGDETRLIWLPMWVKERYWKLKMMTHSHLIHPLLVLLACGLSFIPPSRYLYCHRMCKRMRWVFVCVDGNYILVARKTASFFKTKLHPSVSCLHHHHHQFDFNICGIFFAELQFQNEMHVKSRSSENINLLYNNYKFAHM